MSDRVFDNTTYVCVLTEPSAWLVVFSGQTLSTIQDYRIYGTYGEAVAAGYDGEEYFEPVPVKEEEA